MVLRENVNVGLQSYTGSEQVPKSSFFVIMHTDVVYVYWKLHILYENI